MTLNSGYKCMDNLLCPLMEHYVCFTAPITVSLCINSACSVHNDFLNLLLDVCTHDQNEIFVICTLKLSHLYNL